MTLTGITVRVMLMSLTLTSMTNNDNDITDTYMNECYSHTDDIDLKNVSHIDDTDIGMNSTVT